MNEQTLLNEHILQLEKKVMSYEMIQMESLLAEDFFEFGSSGLSFDKQAIMEAVSKDTTDVSFSYTVTDFKVKQLAPDVVLATYRTRRHPDDKSALRSSIWKLNEGEWQMVFHQGTPTVTS